MPATNPQSEDNVTAFFPRPELCPVVILAERDLEVAHQTEKMFVATGHTVVATSCVQEVEHILARRKVNAIVAGLDFALNSNRELIRRVRLCSPDMPIIFVRSTEPVDQIVSAMKAGAASVLQHPLSADPIVKVMSQVRQASEQIQARRELQRSTRVGMTTLLTLSEREIVQLYAEGLESKEIAAELGVSHRVLRLARETLLAKLAARTMCEALRIVFSR